MLSCLEMAINTSEMVVYIPGDTAVEAVESCAGKSKYSMPPQHVSRHCQPAADDLIHCMDAHQQDQWGQ